MSAEMNSKERPVKSPCVSICALDIDDVCMGCLRSGQEISQWGKMNNEQRLAVLERIKQRAQK